MLLQTSMLRNRSRFALRTFSKYIPIRTFLLHISILLFFFSVESELFRYSHTGRLKREVERPKKATSISQNTPIKKRSFLRPLIYDPLQFCQSKIVPCKRGQSSADASALEPARSALTPRCQEAGAQPRTLAPF